MGITDLINIITRRKEKKYWKETIQSILHTQVLILLKAVFLMLIYFKEVRRGYLHCNMHEMKHESEARCGIV